MREDPERLLTRVRAGRACTGKIPVPQPTLSAHLKARVLRGKSVPATPFVAQ
ncbi:MAG: hypothetical protein ACRETQ_10340 [Gammaproteobacteria bacterium]